MYKPRFLGHIARLSPVALARRTDASKWVSLSGTDDFPSQTIHFVTRKRVRRYFRQHCRSLQKGSKSGLGAKSGPSLPRRRYGQPNGSSRWCRLGVSPGVSFHSKFCFYKFRLKCRWTSQLFLYCLLDLSLYSCQINFPKFTLKHNFLA